MSSVVDFPKRITIHLEEEDYALIIRQHKDGSFSTQSFTPNSIVEAAEKKNPETARAPIEYLMMSFFELALHEEDVLESVMDLIDDYLFSSSGIVRH